MAILDNLKNDTYLMISRSYIPPGNKGYTCYYTLQTSMYGESRIQNTVTVKFGTRFSNTCDIEFLARRPDLGMSYKVRSVQYFKFEHNIEEQ